MGSNEDAFFENLAAGKSNGGDYEAELAKANAVIARAKAKGKNGWDAAAEPEGQLTVDVYQTPDDIVVESAIAGVKPDDIDVNVTNDSISIKGSRHREEQNPDADYLYQECYWGRFSRSIILPQEVDPENAEVTFKNGILTVRLPKVNRKKSRKLNVRID